MATVSVLLLLLLISEQCPLRTFHLIETKMSQSEARAACRVNYTDLVTVCSEEDNAALINLTRNLTEQVWIGLQRSQVSSKWSNGDEVTFSALNGSCGTLPCCAAMKTDASWESLLCTETRNFMCYQQDETDLTFSFHLITQSLTWYEAQSYCRKKYTDLISIRDQDQNEAVKTEGMNSSMSFWIGLLRDDLEWADGGRSAYRNWATGQPRSSLKNNCTVLSNGTWNSVPSSGTFPALCYNISSNMNTSNYCKKEHFSTVFSPAEQSSLRSFHLIEGNLTQSEARAACRVNYTDLVTVYDDKDITTLIKLTGISSAWIGLYRNQSSVKWSNGDEVTFMNLQNSDCGSGPCYYAMTAGGSWEKLSGTEKRNFMCYKRDETDLPLRYHLILEEMTWSEAQSHCRRAYTDLVSIRDQHENEAVMVNGSQSSNPFWIGLLDDAWEWADEGQSAYRNWWSGHPKPSPSDCVKLVLGRLYSVPCSNTGSALCYSTSLHVSDHRMKWENALDYCKQEDRAHLLHIRTKSYNKQVKNELRRMQVSDTFLWVGLGQSQLFGFWFWSDGSGLGSWTNWVGEQAPKNPLSQHCGAINTKKDFKWLDKNCVSKFRAVCALKH